MIWETGSWNPNAIDHREHVKNMLPLLSFRPKVPKFNSLIRKAIFFLPIVHSIRLVEIKTRYSLLQNFSNNDIFVSKHRWWSLHRTQNTQNHQAPRNEPILTLSPNIDCNISWIFTFFKCMTQVDGSIYAEILNIYQEWYH